MQKVILETATKDISNNDILIYRTRNNAFINEKKAVFLGETNNKIKSMEDEITSLKKQINNLQTKFNSLLNLLKKEK